MNELERLQRQTLSTLAQAIGQPKSHKLALLDFPAHANAGDHLIWRGQQRYLAQLGFDVAYVADGYRYSPSALRQRVGRGVILLSGGGSFGDRWSVTQAFREKVITDFPDSRIVQLPQSIEFGSDENLHRTASVLRGHPDFRLLVRDRKSYELAQSAFPSVATELCPDMALGTGVMGNRWSPKVDIVQLLRTDNERSRYSDPPIPSGWSSVRRDWGFGGYQKPAWDLVRAPLLLGRHSRRARVLGYRSLAVSYRAMNFLSLAGAQRTLGLGRLVITDRLHAGVMATLMAIPVVFMDNANGKIRAAYDAYLYTFPSISFASDPAAAIADATQRLVAPQGQPDDVGAAGSSDPRN
ncbi:MAG: epsO [Frondihabitans sp.]|nr:epsO [Frondihabitans sp.]